MAFGTESPTHEQVTVTVVSILVFLEWPLGRDAIEVDRDKIIMFQSLFFWNGLWDSVREAGRGRGEEVSILVFLEWPLGRYSVSGLRYSCRSFNPCFSGMAFGTASGRIRLIFTLNVSILVFLEWPLGPEKRRPVCQRKKVSILVFLEWPLGPSADGYRRYCLAGFQSLFFWNGLWDDVPKNLRGHS